ncbi:MAG: TetR/AcrR family transcriptional regulator [Verrucomicrobiaceae bacterium]
MSLRAVKKIRARRTILDAAHDLFVIKDYTQTTMEAVAVQAEVAVGTLYNYFPTKGDLLLALIADSDEKYIQAGQRLVEQPNDDPVKALADIMVLATEHCVRQVGKSIWCQVSATSLTNSDSSFGVQYALTTRKHEELVVAMMQELQKRGKIRIDIDAAKASHYLFSTKSKLFLNFVGSSTMPLSEHRREVYEAVSYFLVGICDTPAQLVLEPPQEPSRKVKLHKLQSSNRR